LTYYNILTTKALGIVFELCSVNNIKMKKLLFLFMLLSGVAFSTSAQEKVKKEKVKKTSTIPQKVHNTFSKHKKYSGTKVKTKTAKAS
jgi:hypothetical protein